MTQAPKPLEPLLRVPTRLGWRAWLEREHESASRVWLVFYKKSSGKAWLGYDEAVEESLCFGWVDSLVRRIDDETYAQLFTPRKDGGRWSKSNLARMRKLIEQGRMTPAGLARLHVPLDAEPPAEVELSNRAEFSPPLLKMLRANRSASRHFDALSPSRQAMFVKWVMNAKLPETRERRMNEAIGRLEKGLPLGLK